MKFITEAKQARLDRDDGKQVDSADVAKLVISDLNQRVNLAMVWGYSKEEATILVEGAYDWWKKAKDQEVPTTWKPTPKVEAEAEPQPPTPQGPPPGVGEVKTNG